MAEHVIPTEEGNFKVRGRVGRVSVSFGTQEPPETEHKIEHNEESSDTTFTRNTFEDALDRVSRPVKGRFAHLPYGSEQFIKEKREEAELEDR